MWIAGAGRCLASFKQITPEGERDVIEDPGEIERHHNPKGYCINEDLPLFNVDKDRRGLPAPHVASGGGKKDEDSRGSVMLRDAVGCRGFITSPIGAGNGGGFS
jgi:hypothetical protein